MIKYDFSGNDAGKISLVLDSEFTYTNLRMIPCSQCISGNEYEGTVMASITFVSVCGANKVTETNKYTNGTAMVSEIEREPNMGDNSYFQLPVYSNSNILSVCHYTSLELSGKDASLLTLVTYESETYVLPVNKNPERTYEFKVLIKDLKSEYTFPDGETNYKITVKITEVNSAP